jgi:tRNA-splicing ligase RtcB
VETLSRIVEFGPVEEPVRQQISACADVEDGAPAVLCADNHLGYSMPIGGVVGYRAHVSPSAVGYDIACGNCAVRTDILASTLDRKQVMDEVWRVLSFGMGRNNAEKIEHPVLDEIAECAHPFQRGLAQMAANQLGTIGSGNHYVDLFEDMQDGYLWVGVHFGSRGFGHKTATWALEKVGAKDDSMMAPPVTIQLGTELATLYLDGMNRAGRYAYAGRDWVVDRVLRILGAQATMRVHNHHNFAWFEKDAEGLPILVHRKGATPAFPGQLGFVGGTMSEPAVILEGVESPLSAAALYSTVHGAGRVLSRTRAAGKQKRTKEWRCGQRACAKHESGWPMPTFNRGPNDSLPKCPECGGKLRPHTSFSIERPGVVNFGFWQVQLANMGIELRGAGADEAPECYKRLDEVLAYHAGTVNIVHRLMPIGVAMAGRDVADPFRD